MSDADFPAPFPHEPLQQVLLGVYVALGSISLPVPGARISRNMVVIRDNGDLTLINPIRLSSGEEQRLTALGTVKHVVRLGNAHGLDDHYYVQRFSAKFWCQTGVHNYAKPGPAEILQEGGPLPFTDAQVCTFAHTKTPEAAILLDRHGGLLITCDSLQHWTDWRHCTVPARLLMRFALRMKRPPWSAPFGSKTPARRAAALNKISNA